MGGKDNMIPYWMSTLISSPGSNKRMFFLLCALCALFCPQLLHKMRMHLLDSKTMKKALLTLLAEEDSVIISFPICMRVGLPLNMAHYSSMFPFPIQTSCCCMNAMHCVSIAFDPFLKKNGY